VANALMAKLEGRNRLWNWKPDPLERYAAVKFLHEKGYFAEGTAERVIAREYVDAFDSYIRTANSSKTVKDILKEAGSRPDMLQGLEDKTGWRNLIEDHLYGKDHETPEPPETASAEKKAATPKPLLRR
jgi:hypothetical protein